MDTGNKSPDKIEAVIAILVILAVLAFIFLPDFFKSKKTSGYAGGTSDRCRKDVSDALKAKGNVTCIASAQIVQCPNNPNFKYTTNPCIAGYLIREKGWK